MRMPAVQPRLSETPGRIRHAGPRVGEHTLEVLTGHLALNADEVAALRDAGVVGLGAAAPAARG
jgi:crotonobetainyl-CoA:carnitine CoA-transferase CaiB-like acyl-CoA transferase